MEHLIREARAAWPAITGDDARFAAYVTERGSGDPAHIGDLYLAWACTSGDRAALTAFEDRYIVDLAAVVRQMRVAAALADDILQRVRDKVLVGKDGAPPKLADYSGRGPLKGWLRAVATRTALDAMRSEARRATSDEALLEHLPAAFEDPTTAELRRRFAPQFADAFRTAFAQLPTAERLLLKRHFADGLTTHQIGVIEGVHRGTVLRRLTRALDDLGRRIAELLRERIGLAPTELSELVRAIRSQLELSISALRSSSSEP